MAICAGPIFSIGKVWQDKAETSLATLGLTLFTGSYPQSPWGYLSTNHPEQALGYNGLAYVASGASVRRAVIGAGARVDAGADIRDSVLLPGALVRAGAVVEHSVVGERAVVGEGARLSDLTVVGGGAEVGGGEEHVAGRVA